MTGPVRFDGRTLFWAALFLSGCWPTNCFTPTVPAPPGGCQLTGLSCAAPMDESCQAIATNYCQPLLRQKMSGVEPTACDLAACASSINDQFIAASQSARAQLVSRLSACAMSAADGGASDLLRCPEQAITDVAVAMVEKGPVVPFNALTLPGDRAQQVRCAYSQCLPYVANCFDEPPPDAGSAAADTCRTYRACLAECTANISDLLRRSRCVREQCDPVYPAGRGQFVSYRDCMNKQDPACGAMAP